MNKSKKSMAVIMALPQLSLCDKYSFSKKLLLKMSPTFMASFLYRAESV